MTTVYGIDIQTENIRSSTVHPRFCFVKVVEGEIAETGDNLSLPRLLKHIKRENPEILAVDSVHEIAGNTTDLYWFLSSLPPTTSLVQVSGDGVSMSSLLQVAARYNLKCDSVSPMDKARVTALIAFYGGGYEVVAFEGVTLITISRSRPLGRGGWSHNRDIRKVHGEVNAKAREIETKLRAASIRYTTTVHNAFGGVSRIGIEVHAARNEVPISSMRWGKVHVTVDPKKRDRILYVSRDQKTPYVIVGVDPGTTVGVAILNLDGKVLHLESVRAQSPAELISVISSVGIPVLVATDKADMPAGVEKIRRAFGAIGWTPKKDVLVKDKYAADEGYAFADDHQRDSLAAALMAYRSYLPKFENESKRFSPGMTQERIRAEIIKGKSSTLITGSDCFTSPSGLIPAAEIDNEFDAKDYTIFQLEGELSKLRTLTRELSEELEQKEETLKKVQHRLNRSQREKIEHILALPEVIERDTELKRLKKALRKEERRSKNLRVLLERMKRYIALTAGDGCLALKVLPLLSRDAVRTMDMEMGVGKDDILYILKVDGWGKSVIHDIANAHVRAVILPKLVFKKAGSQNLIDEFHECNVPLLSGEFLSTRVRGKIGVVDESAFVQAETEWKRSQEIFMKRKQTENLQCMVSAYQVQRRRDVHLWGIEPLSILSSDIPQKSAMNDAPQENSSIQIGNAVGSGLCERKERVPSSSLKSDINPPSSDILTSVIQTYRQERERELHLK